MSDSFFIMDEKPSEGFDSGELPGFSLDAPERSEEIMEFLNSRIRIGIVKYLELADRIRQQLGGEFAEKTAQQAAPEKTASTKKAGLKDGDTWVYRRAGREIKVKLSSSQYQDYCWDEIDNFIQHPPKRKKAIDLENIAEDQSVMASIIADKELASETLAQLHLQQGHRNKAIKIYEKLSLLFPEKKAYFADQIQKIKTK